MGETQSMIYPEANFLAVNMQNQTTYVFEKFNGRIWKGELVEEKGTK